MSCSFANLELVDVQYVFRLYKLHGSFIWFWSGLIGNIGLYKAIEALYSGESRGKKNDLRWFYTDEQKSNLQPIILITSTHLKDLRNVYIGILWRKTKRWTQKIACIGYSLSGDDLHITYLFKRSIAT